MDVSLHGIVPPALELRLSKLEQSIKEYLDIRLDALKQELLLPPIAKDNDENLQQTNPEPYRPPLSSAPLASMAILLEASKRALDNAWRQLHANADNNAYVMKTMPDEVFHKATKQIVKIKNMMDFDSYEISQIYPEALVLCRVRIFFVIKDICDVFKEK